MDPILVVRTCKPDLTSYNNFQYPESGYVECPDWYPYPVCGGGLHGLPWGQGHLAHLSSKPHDKWLIIAVDPSPRNYIHGEGELIHKCKFKAGMVVYCGTKSGALEYLTTHATPEQLAGHGAVHTSLSTVLARHSSLSVAEGGLVTDRVMNIGHQASAINKVIGGIAIATGQAATATTKGYASIALAAEAHSTAHTAGTNSIALSYGLCGTALTEGAASFAIAYGNFSAVQGRLGSIITILWHDIHGDAKITTATIDGENFLPNVPYTLDGNGRFVQKDEER